MESLQFEAVVIGGGVVGMACARALSERNLSVLVIERHSRFGTETTARNSEVIHAGFYYEAGSLKERLCVEGRPLLYEFCEKYDVPHRRCGKLIVAASVEESSVFDKIVENAARNEIPLNKLTRKELQKLEPRVAGEYALESPVTGIVCSELLLQRLRGLVEEQGALAVCDHEVTHWDRVGTDYELFVRGPSGERLLVKTPIVINSSGLQALELGKRVFGSSPPFHLKYVRGHYLSLNQRYKNMASRLVYPIPDVKGGGLGIHLTIDLEGNCRLGPDTDWRKTDVPDYAFVDSEIPSLIKKFYASAKYYLPELREQDIQPGFIGVRPKLIGHDGKMLDFYVRNETDRGFNGWVNLLGIESPGLTSALAIANEVKKLI